MSPASGRKAVRFRRFPGSVGAGRELSSGGSMNRRTIERAVAVKGGRLEFLVPHFLRGQVLRPAS